MTATSLSGCGAVEAGALHANVSASTRVLQELRSRIAQAAARHDPEPRGTGESRDALRQHLSGTIGRLPELMDAHPNLFAR